jgi:hypothetical protein
MIAADLGERFQRRCNNGSFRRKKVPRMGPSQETMHCPILLLMIMSMPAIWAVPGGKEVNFVDLSDSYVFLFVVLSAVICKK